MTIVAVAVAAFTIAVAAGADDADAGAGPAATPAGDAAGAATAEQNAFAAVGDKRWCEAEALFEDAFDAEPNVSYLLNAAKAARSAEDFDLARTLAARVAGIAPERARESGTILVELGDKKSVITCPPRPPKPAPATTTTTTTTVETTAPATLTTTTTTTAPPPPPTPPTTAPADGPTPLFLAGAITAGVGAAVLVGAAGYASYLEVQLNDVGHVGAEKKRGDLAQAAPVGAALIVGVAVAAVGGVLIGVGG